MMRHLKRMIGQRSPVRLAWHKAKAFRAASRYGFPAKQLRIIGITGTDGKTTTTAMTAHILHEAGIKVGAVSTSFFRIKDRTEENPTHKTSLTPDALQKFLKRCKDEGCTTVVVEASSHGLVQHRLDYLWPAVAAITNTAEEHLDYHKTMEQYRKDKGILFQMLQGKGTKVLNTEDATFALYTNIPSDHTISYSSQSQKNAPTLWTTDIKSTPTETRATIHYPLQPTTYSLALPLPGSFNIQNALCAISCVLACGIDTETSIKALATFTGVPGRMERIDEGQDFFVFVDFTVTPQAYEQTLSAAKAMLTPGKRLLVLTSTCGDRMREKRPEIGKIVSSMADVVIVTEDETLTEDPQRTIDDLWAGIDQSKSEAHQVLHRRDAVKKILSIAHSGDIVMLCGMGACTTMQTQQGLRPWDERQVAREVLREMR